mmetsp:Transcript_28657/g.48423  ORF Transcript_28657/g.48423 Transcript_28657/m.48423 type:complete len:440 (-) Transcript_28657:169-1488(-)
MDQLLRDFGLDAYADNFRELGLNTPLKISAMTSDDTDGLKMKIIHKKKLTKMLNFLSETPPIAEAEDKNLPPISDDDEGGGDEEGDEEERGSDSDLSSQTSSRRGESPLSSGSDGRNSNFMSYMGAGASTSNLPVVKAKKEERKKQKQASFAVPSNADVDGGSSTGSSPQSDRGSSSGGPKMPKSATMALFSGQKQSQRAEPEYEESESDAYDEEESGYDAGGHYDEDEDEEKGDSEFYVAPVQEPEFVRTPKSQVHAVSAMLAEAEQKEHELVGTTVMKTKELDRARAKLKAAKAALAVVVEANAAEEARWEAATARLDVHLASDVAETTLLAEKEARVKHSVTDLNEQDEDLDDQLELDKDSLEAKGEEIVAFLHKNEDIEDEKLALTRLIAETKEKLAVKRWGLGVAKRQERVSKASHGLDKGPTKYYNVRSTMYK